MDAIAPTTELEAVNEILAAISESPVNSLTSGNADVQEAVRLLRQESRATQKRGYWFNTEVVTLSPSLDAGSGEYWLTLPSNTLKARVARSDWDRLYVIRGNRLYDTDNNTYNIATAIDVELVVGLDFIELPESARSFITASAGYVFCDTQMGAEPNRIFTRERVRDARALLMQDDVETARPNMVRDSWGSASVMRRSI